jgi:hypothetical protein
MIAHGFTIERMVELVRAGLATRVSARSRLHVWITDTGRQRLGE